MSALYFGDPAAIAQARPTTRYRAAQLQREAAGLHQTGRALAAGDHPGAGRTCRDCAHRVARRFAKTYHKCDLNRVTSGPASDIQVGWPACERWEERHA